MPIYSAFQRHKRVAHGNLQRVAVAMRELQSGADDTLVLLFEEESGRQIDVDLRGSVDQVAERFATDGTEAEESTAGPKKRGRPKLGVVGREVTLLPRHWDWLQHQRGGPSATLRRLVDEARAASVNVDRARYAQDAINRFISAVAGNLPGFEEANRALFRANREEFETQVVDWPKDVLKQIAVWASAAFGETDKR